MLACLGQPPDTTKNCRLHVFVLGELVCCGRTTGQHWAESKQIKHNAQSFFCFSSCRLYFSLHLSTSPRTVLRSTVWLSARQATVEVWSGGVEVWSQCFSDRRLRLTVSGTRADAQPFILPTLLQGHQHTNSRVQATTPEQSRHVSPKLQGNLNPDI